LGVTGSSVRGSNSLSGTEESTLGVGSDESDGCFSACATEAGTGKLVASAGTEAPTTIATIDTPEPAKCARR
jgi:hypothetical protein